MKTLLQLHSSRFDGAGIYAFKFNTENGEAALRFSLDENGRFEYDGSPPSWFNAVARIVPKGRISD